MNPQLYEWAKARKNGSKIAKLPKHVFGNFSAPPPPHIANRQRAHIANTDAVIDRQHELPSFLNALKLIPANCSYDDWFQLGAAIHDFDPGPDGLLIFKTWSKTSAEHQNDSDQVTCEKKWLEYDKPQPAGKALITKATIYGAALKINGAPALPPSLTAQALAPNPLIELNEKHSVIADVGGKCLVLSWISSKVDKSVQIPSFQSFTSFRERYQNQYVRVNGDAVAIGKYWLGWTGRQTYEGIDLVPNGEPLLAGNVLNLWRGFAVEPQPGDWSLMQWHICNTLAKGNTDLATYIIKWAAWAVQHPEEPAEVALVLKGGKGTGKSTFGNTMRRLFGQHGMQVYSSRHLTGNFNAHLRSCLLLFSDEAFWAGDKQGESTLKAILTEPTIVIEQKGVDATPWTNRLHIIMAANADWVVPASHDERRFQMAELDDEPKSYFAALHKQMKEGGLAAMLHDLLRVDLTGWHPRKIVHTEALRDQKIQTMDDKSAWWESLLQEGRLPFQDKSKPDVCKASVLLENARNYMGYSRYPITEKALGMLLKVKGCIKIHTKFGNLWLFPPLNRARTTWEKYMHGWKWDIEINEWRSDLPQL